MYDELLNNLTYKILFSEFDVFHQSFWFGCAFISEFFFAYWGVRIGAKFLRQVVLNP